MNIKQIFIGIFTASLFSLSIATETSSNLPDSLSVIPEWIYSDNGSHSAVGNADIIRTTSENGDEKRELWDIEMAESEAIHMAKNKLYEQLADRYIEDQLNQKIESGVYCISEIRFFKKDKIMGKISIKKSGLEKIIDTAEPVDLWIDHNRHRVWVLVKLPQYSIKKIQELRKFNAK